MRILNPDGSFDPSPYDVIGIMKDTSTGRFHACLWWDHPFPGTPDPSPQVIRLKSKAHHTGGADTFEGAVLHAQELHTKFKVADTNLWIEPGQAVERDFKQFGYADIMILPNWLKANDEETRRQA